MTRFEDPAIVESSGLAVVDGMFVTTNDSGDTGRVFAVDLATGRTVGVTTWSAEPDDVEALAPAAADGEVWVGDIGDNQRRAFLGVGGARAGRRRATVDVDVPSYELVYPEGARDAESLLADPATGRLYVVSKGVLGGALYAAPERLSARKPNRLEEVGPVLGIATDAAFFPDGRHIIVRSYSEAAVYSWPELEEVGRFGLPDQQQGEGIAVAPRRHDLRLVGGAARAGAADLAAGRRTHARWRPSPRRPRRRRRRRPPSPTPPPGTREGSELPEQPPADRSAWGWALGGILGLGIVSCSPAP